MQDLDAALPEDHQARIIRDFLERLDLGTFYASIQEAQGSLVLWQRPDEGADPAQGH